MKIHKQFIKGNTVDTVKEDIMCVINHDYKLFAFDCKKDVAAFFGVDDVSELYSRVEDTLTFRGEQVGGWIPTITATITAYYMDPGSFDYCYLINVVED